MIKAWIHRILMVMLIAFVLKVDGQPPVNRYNAELFGSWTETSDVLFSQGVPQPNPGGGFYEAVTGLPLNVNEYDTTHIDLYMDVFEPTGDTLSKRPLVIICFGGGFLSGSRDHWSIRLLCQSLAKRGYVTAAIDYRLGMNIFDEDLSMRAVYRGLQDGRTAVRYFREDAATSNSFRIDPDKIFIGGHSSGGFIALHNAFLEKESERPLSTYSWIQDGNAVADQLSLDAVGGHYGYSGYANGYFNLAGALGMLDFIEEADDPNGISFHSTDDDTVPYGAGTPFSSILWLVVGADLPTVYGSSLIETESATVGNLHDFNSYTNRGHGVHENTSNTLYFDIIPSINDHLFNNDLKPKEHSFDEDTLVCSPFLTKLYTIEDSTIAYFDWILEGGAFTQMSSNNGTVEVEWDQNAMKHSLSVVPYTHLDAKGDTVSLIIDVNTNASNEFLFVNQDWSDIQNWSLNHLPSQCEDVIVGDRPHLYTLTLDEDAYINSLILGTEVELSILPNNILDINQKTTYSNPLIFTKMIINEGSIFLK